MSITRLGYIALLLVVCACWQPAPAGVGESAVITLVFPPGARATGLGEAFTGMSDDVNATYFNPAGLGQAPLANAWHVYLQKGGNRFTCIAARRKKPFELREEVWAGTANGVLRYNGRAWEAFESHLIEEGDQLESVLEKSFGEQDQQWTKRALAEIRKANGIDVKRAAALRVLFQRELSGAMVPASPTAIKVTPDSTARTADTSHAAAPAPADTAGDSTAPVAAGAGATPAAPQPLDLEQLLQDILALPNADRNATRVYGLIAGRVDSTKADRLSDEIDSILRKPDKDIRSLVELKVPFSIAVHDSVTAVRIDDANQVWVGTAGGLWRYDGSSWKRFTVLEGLPSNRISAIAVSENGAIAAGTDRGVAIYADGNWKVVGVKEGLPDSQVTAVTFGKGEDLYVGTRRGLARRKANVWDVLDTADGLLSPYVSALLLDSQGKLWVGGPSGVALYDKVSWKRYKFPDSRVFCISEYANGRVWIGTDRGLVRYRSGRVRTDKQGARTEKPPEWKVFHAKNGLTGTEVRGIAVHGRDAWLATDIAINRYDNAEKQFMFFWEPLLPAFNLPDLWHLYFAGVWPTEDWGTIGFTVNYINMGVNPYYDELGRETGSARSWEGIFGASYGLQLRRDFSIGLNAKFVNSALAPGIGSGSEGTGRTFAIDVGLLKRNLFHLRGVDLGFMLQNMGPAIFYISKDQSDPIPFTLRLGLAYRAIETPVHDLSLVLDLYREFVDRDSKGNPRPFYQALFTDFQPDSGNVSWSSIASALSETQISAGLEYWYVQFLALRTGLLIDYEGERYEWTFGMGLRYGSINFDWSYIYSPEGFLKWLVEPINSSKTGATGARNGQYRLSLILRF